MNTAIATRHSTLLRQLGSAAFIFFLVKGLMWLAAPFLFLWFI